MQSKSAAALTCSGEEEGEEGRAGSAGQENTQVVQRSWKLTSGILIP